jgi:phosphoribosylformimino-5-aminoimidazole carboxamide ribotide isomerase
VTQFELIPAIDLLGGKCVRLTQGDYAAATEYEADPAAVAARFAAHRIQRLHVVDLDGAKRGEPVNTGSVRAILDATRGIPLELGGGIRTLAGVETWLGLGVERAILGTAALRDPALVRDAAKRFPGRIGVGIDARGGKVAVQGWLETSETDALTLARRFEDAGVSAIIYTDIARDGTGAGVNLAETVALARAISIPVIASGGVGSLADVRAARVSGVAGLIVGRALYTGAVDLTRAMEIACS